MGKIINLEQNTRDWLDYRKKRIGASDVPIIMGKSPYKTAYELWLEKTGQALPPEMNMAMQRGKDLEPIAKEIVEKKFGLTLEPLVMEHPEMDFLMASLDGFDMEKDIVWETKAPGIAEHNSISVNGIPPKYYHQVQTQLMVSGASKCLFTTIFEGPNNDGYDINFIWAYPNKETFREIEEAVRKFWFCVQTGTPPDATPEDFELRTDDAWKSVVEDYKDKYAALKVAEIEEQRSKERLIDQMRGKKNSGFGVSVVRSERMGNIDYKSIPELKNVDLNRYRKPASEVVTVRVLDS